jgi:acyl carrier protein
MERFIFLLSEILNLPADQVSPETVLDKIETWDSMAMVQFLAMADLEYNKNIIIEDLLEAATVKDLYSLGVEHAGHPS